MTYMRRLRCSLGLVMLLSWLGYREWGVAIGPPFLPALSVSRFGLPQPTLGAIGRLEVSVSYSLRWR
jgi:hypothetical protein